MANKKKAAFDVRRIRDFRAKIIVLEEKVRVLTRTRWILEAKIQEFNDVLEMTISTDDGIERLGEWIETGEWPQDGEQGGEYGV